MADDTSIILVVEDDENDVFFLKHAFDTEGIRNPLQVVWGGQQAIDYLAGNKQYADRKKFPLPRLILLDLKLPQQSGLEVLAWMRTQPQLGKILTVVLSSSALTRDVASALELGARSYLTKPSTMDARRKMVKMIKEYWLELNKYAVDE